MARKPASIKVLMDGLLVPCAVVERMGYVHDIGAYAACVLHEGKEMMVTKGAGIWRPWTARDRVRPLLEGLALQAERRKRERCTLAETIVDTPPPSDS